MSLVGGVPASGPHPCPSPMAGRGESERVPLPARGISANLMTRSTGQAVQLEAALARGLGESAGDSWPLGETSGEVQVGTNGPLDEMDHE